jgi:hypothetical protein
MKTGYCVRLTRKCWEPQPSDPRLGEDIPKMNASDLHDRDVIVGRLCDQAIRDAVRITLHAHQEMVDEDISYDEVKEALLGAHLVENYPDHKRGACCLTCGYTNRNRYIHVVCTTSQEVAVVITAYEPKPPKWTTAFERRK